MSNSRSKKFVINFIFTITLELITIISSLILPKYIIEVYGSDTNGLINSISGFLGYLTLLQSGAGGVIKAALYKPLAKNNKKDINIILNTSNNFFKKLAYFTFVYIFILSMFFTFKFSSSFKLLFIITLVFLVSMGTIFQYSYGISAQLLLQADQKSYINTIFQIFLIIFNLIFCVIAIKMNFSILIVQLITAILYSLKPILLNYYVYKKYDIKSGKEINNSLIRQRWDGFGHTVAYFVHTKVDVFCLTIFSTLKNVSIYSVYSLVTGGLATFLNAISLAIQGAFGNIIAKDEIDNLKKYFNVYLTFNTIISNILFGVAIFLILPFVKLYTAKINDIGYLNFVFGFLFLVSEWLYCFRMPYHTIIIAAGKYKETKKGAFLEALINTLITLALVCRYDLVGVAIGTFCAMLYRTIDYVIFLKTNILKYDIADFIKRFILSIICFAIFTLVYLIIPRIDIKSYVLFIVCGVIYFIIYFIIVVGIFFLFYKKDFIIILNKLRRRGVLLNEKNRIK